MMDRTPRVSHRFRQLLKQHIPHWQSDRIINAEQVRLLTEKYDLDKTSTEARSMLMLAIYIIGVVLIGAGVISFVAYHWIQIPRQVKVVMIISAMLACHISGFYLWLFSGRSPHLGHALTVLGTIIFGANIGLLAQIFHIQENAYNGLYAWAVGAAIMAYALRSTPNAVIAIVVSFIGFSMWIDTNPHSFAWYPLAAAVVFLPLACLTKSVFQFLLTLLAVGISIIICAICDVDNFTTFLLASICMAVLYSGLGFAAMNWADLKPFAVTALILAAVLLALIAYMTSFQELAEETEYILDDQHWDWVTPAVAACAAGIALWIFGIKTIATDPTTRLLAIGFFAAAVLMAFVVVLRGLTPHGHDRDAWLIVVVLANVACGVLVFTLIAASFIAENRLIFWAGILFAALVITSRFLEYETELLIKAGVFTGCGVALIVAGVAFERFLGQRRLVNE